jgi:ribosomal protein S18 acetylase RimI-like enzyme
MRRYWMKDREVQLDSDFSIQPLEAQDEPFLWEMLYQAIYVPEGRPRPPRSILEAPELAQYAQQWGKVPGDLGYKAVEIVAGQLVGAAWLRLFTNGEKGYGYVDDRTPELSIAILPGYRGQGLGGLLLAALLEEARRSFKTVSLSVSRDNPAIRLYRRLGFEVVSESDSSFTMLLNAIRQVNTDG